MPYKTCLMLVLSCLFFPLNGFAKSITREGQAIVTLVDIQFPDKARQGDLFRVFADFKLSKGIQEDAGIFLHIVNPSNGKKVLHADFLPQPAISTWAPGEIVSIGPVFLYIPEDVPVGEYNISVGIITFLKDKTGETTYMREPYTNTDIKDFTVRKITVEKSPARREEAKELIISDFKSAEDINKWEARNSSIELFDSSSGKVGQVKFQPNVEYPAIILESFFKRAEERFVNWSNYDYLEMEVYQAPDAKGLTAFFGTLTLQLKDADGKRCKFYVEKPPSKGTPFKVPLSKAGSGIDLTRIGNFTLFTGSVNKEYTFYVSNLKLVNYGEYAGTGPFVKFEGIELSPQKVSVGEDISLALKFSLTRRFFQDHILFIHIFNPEKKEESYMNIDLDPSPPATDWETGRPITQGPFRVHIPLNAPPGKYVVEAGFSFAYNPPEGAVYVKCNRGKDGVFYLQQPSFPVDYIKQPYINYQEYGDWVVGNFEVLPKR